VPEEPLAFRGDDVARQFRLGDVVGFRRARCSVALASETLEQFLLPGQNISDPLIDSLVGHKPVHLYGF
jgi:hypothetical protein